jgi:hypothetical protein
MSWGQTRLLADHDIVYMHLKKKTKNRKGLSQESKNLLKTNSWPIVSCGLTNLHCTFHLVYLLEYNLSSCPSADLLADHRPIALTCWPTVRVRLLLTIGGYCGPPFSLSDRLIILCFHWLPLFIPFDLFLLKLVSTMPHSFRVNYPFAPKFAWYLLSSSWISSRDRHDQSLVPSI